MNCTYSENPPFVCTVCGHEWKRLDLCNPPPPHNCSIFQGENTPPKSQSEILLAYLLENPEITAGELVGESKCGCQDKGRDAIKKLIKEGKIIEIPVDPLPLLRVA
jgi:hypothetical protein